MDVAQPGRGIGRDIGRGEGVEHELNAFITKRHNDRVSTEGEQVVEEAWRASERREEARQAEEERAGRIGVFRHLQRVYAARSLECGHAADELEGIGGAA